MTALRFEKLVFEASELTLQNVLQVGQAFRWILDEEANEYLTTMRVGNNTHYSIVILRQSDDTSIEYATTDPKCDPLRLKAHLSEYFRLEVSLRDLLYNEWLKRDPRFKTVGMRGVRILSQEPWETLITFICSSNNNISRITRMCHALCSNYGNEVGSYRSTKFYSFPTSDELLERSSEEKLRALGFGYRGKYIIETAKKMVADKAALTIQGDKEISDAEFLRSSTSGMDYEHAREYLMSFCGVGPKVADCTALMGLHIDHVVPIDVHIGRIATRDYGIVATKKNMEDIRKELKELPISKKKINPTLEFARRQLEKKWGPFAGWAQGVLFSKEVGATSGATTEGKIKKRRYHGVESEKENESADGMLPTKIPKMDGVKG